MTLLSWLPLQFASPWILLALASLPAIWWLLRLTPPRPQREVFPPTQILLQLKQHEETPAQSPWWLTLLRFMIAALVIFAMAGPVLNPTQKVLDGKNPVILVFDDGWASAKDWDNRLATALEIVQVVENSGSTITLISTTGRSEWPQTPLATNEARNILQASTPTPFESDHAKTLARLETVFDEIPQADIVFLSDGLNREKTPELVDALAEHSDKPLIFLANTEDLSIIETVENDPKELFGTVSRANMETATELSVLALDRQGIEITRSRAIFNSDQKRARFAFNEPVELRNQIARLEIQHANNAAAVQLLDENNRRRLIGLISGEKFDQSQPLLSPLYYISNALEPFADIRRADDANVAVAAPELVNQGVSAIFMADIGVLPQETVTQLEEWIEKGGMLVRFSGSRLSAAGNDALLPVEIRPGDRNLGGALTWETPKPLAAFGPDSPFFGLETPRDVLVNKQVLALQEPDLEKKTWAILEDGTPLVTAKKQGNGWIVLFHVGANAEWSNLPLSGTFVEMLRRVIKLSKSSTIHSNDTKEQILEPLNVLDGRGELIVPGVSVKPLVLSADVEKQVTLDNPPGFYGTEEGTEALNLFEKETILEPLLASKLPGVISIQKYSSGKELPLSNWLMWIAAVLFLLDSFVMLWMGGAIRRIGSARSSTATILALCLVSSLFLHTNPSQAEETTDFSPTLQTRLAYAITGNNEVDRISKEGLFGLTQYLASRTSLEPGPPVGLDLSKDELAFYSLIYWPVSPDMQIPDAATMARVDNFMKQGGSILFDTQDQISGPLGGTSASPAAKTLQQILSSLDIPPLEPVPTDHVLTKSFYLLDRFPGRYSGGDLWVEKSQIQQSEYARPVRVGDGVSSILITSNDLAGAWAIDQSLRPLYPTIPPDPLQRSFAFRTGVNIVMYVLTGNYKSDQVHINKILERLGQ